MDIETIVKEQTRTKLIQKTLLTKRQDYLMKLLFTKEFLLNSEPSGPDNKRDKRNDLRVWSDYDSEVLK